MSEARKTESNIGEGISMKELLIKCIFWLKYLKSKLVFILAFTLLGCIVGVAFTSLRKPVYSALCTFVLEEADKGSSLGNLGGLASMVGLDLGSGGGLFQGDNIMQLYKSRSMIEKTLLSPVQYKGKMQLLIDRYIIFNNLRAKWSEQAELSNISFQGVPRANFNRLQDSVLGRIVERINKENLFIKKPDKSLSIISVEVKSTDEFFAKAFNDQIVKNVNDFYVQTKTKKSLQNLKILQYQTDSVRNVLNGAIYQSVAVADATPNLNPTRQILRAPAQRYQLNAEANKIMLAELVKNLELAKLSLRRETPLIQVIDEPIFPLINNKIGRGFGLIVGGIIFGLVGIFLLILRKSFIQILT